MKVVREKKTSSNGSLTVYRRGFCTNMSETNNETEEQRKYRYKASAFLLGVAGLMKNIN